jgi:V-type H+-transporting ATPase subunit a
MLAGLVLELLNHIHFKHYAYIFMEFIPEFLILGCTFGYLCVMIIVKWAINWENSPTPPPDLIHTMTEFFLHPLSAADPPLYTGQLVVQISFLIIAGISVICLLVPTPIYEYLKHKGKKAHEVYHASHEHELKDMEEISLDEQPKRVSRKDDDEEEFSLQETIVKQLIHTIEFALGSVSNTASYLRLWALSLAHAGLEYFPSYSILELSEVFYELTIKMSLTFSFGIPFLDTILFKSGIVLFVTFNLWLLLTLGVLLGMESLGAFLHSLRLHW